MGIHLLILVNNSYTTNFNNSCHIIDNNISDLLEIFELYENIQNKKMIKLLLSRRAPRHAAGLLHTFHYSINKT